MCLCNHSFDLLCKLPDVCIITINVLNAKVVMQSKSIDWFLYDVNFGVQLVYTDHLKTMK